MAGASVTATRHRLATRPRAVDIALLPWGAERRIAALAKQRRLGRPAVVVLQATDARGERGFIGTERAVPPALRAGLGHHTEREREHSECRCSENPEHDFSPL